MGFVACMAPYIVCYSSYGTTMDNNQETSPLGSRLPNYYYLIFLACYFTYRMFDEFDGKQARRTGNSTPLGMLFDHGCDAFCISAVMLTGGKFLTVGDSATSLAWVSGSLAMFHAQIMEEYYVGGMVFSHCNAVTDGSFAAYALFLYMGIAGNSFASDEVFAADYFGKGSGPWRSIDIFMFVSFGIQLINIGLCVRKCFVMQKFEGKGF